jgi:hypothetical protein
VSCFTRSVCYGVSRACLVLVYCVVLRGRRSSSGFLYPFVVLCSLDRLCPTTLLLLDVECVFSMFLCTALHCSENRQQSCMFNTALCCVQRAFMHPSHMNFHVC